MRLRRAKADSSSDSSHSTRSSVASGETIGEQIVKALGRLEHDMRLVLRRLDSIENRITDVNHAVSRRCDIKNIKNIKTQQKIRYSYKKVCIPLHLQIACDLLF